MYVELCLYVWPSQPGKVANPARGQQLNGKLIIRCPRSRLRIWSRESGSAVPSRVSLLISILNLVLAYGIPPEFRGGVHSSSVHIMYYGCSSVCVFFPFILDIQFVGRTSRGHTGGRSHRISHPPSFWGVCLHFSREKDSATPFPRPP